MRLLVEGLPALAHLPLGHLMPHAGGSAARRSASRGRQGSTGATVCRGGGEVEPVEFVEAVGAGVDGDDAAAEDVAGQGNGQHVDGCRAVLHREQRRREALAPPRRWPTGGARRRNHRQPVVARPVTRSYTIAARLAPYARAVPSGVSANRPHPMTSPSPPSRPRPAGRVRPCRRRGQHHRKAGEHTPGSMMKSMSMMKRASP